MPCSRAAQLTTCTCSHAVSCLLALEQVTLEELRALNDSVEWRHMTPDAIEAVQSSMKPRKQEWLVLDGKPVPGAKEAVHEGPWHEGNPSLGWASVPDTVDLPRYVDGAALEWANINTKGRNEQGFLEVRHLRHACLR